MLVIMTLMIIAIIIIIKYYCNTWQVFVVPAKYSGSARWWSTVQRSSAM